MLDTMNHPYDGSDRAAGRVDVRELDDASVLSFVVNARRSADREEADLLAGVVYWADLHPVVDQPGSLVPDVAASFEEHRALDLTGPADNQARCGLAGDGT